MLPTVRSIAKLFWNSGEKQFFNLTRFLFLHIKPGDLCYIKNPINHFYKDGVLIWDRRGILEPGDICLIVSIEKIFEFNSLYSAKTLKYNIKVLYNNRTYQFHFPDFEIWLHFKKIS